jgi:hypothetical protein
MQKPSGNWFVHHDTGFYNPVANHASTVRNPQNDPQQNAELIFTEAPNGGHKLRPICARPAD